MPSWTRTPVWTGQVVVGRTAKTVSSTIEPRYDEGADVYIGIQGSGADSAGRPILDAEFTADGVYVVPVDVDPTNEDPYLAAAKLDLGSGATDFTVVKIYDDVPAPGDNRTREGLREIEVDSEGNVYVINSGSENESDVLWRFKPNDTVETIELGNPASTVYIPSPVALHMSDTTDTVLTTPIVAHRHLGDRQIQLSPLHRPAQRE